MNVRSAIVSSRQADTTTPRPVSVLMLILGAGLLLHAAVVIAQWVDLPIWVAVLECLCASMVGLWQLRSLTAAQDRAATEPRSEEPLPPSVLRSVASPWVGSLGAFPARVTNVPDEHSEPAVRG
jgi:hypothetical protein